MRVRTRTEPVGIVPSLANSELVAVDDARGVDLAGDQRLHGVALAADVVAVLGDHDVEAAHGERRAGVEAQPGEVGQRQQRGLRRVDRAGGDRAPREAGHVGDVAVAADQHDRGQVLVGVAHGDSTRRAALRRRRGGECEPTPTASPR